MATDRDLADLFARAEAWLADDPDPATREELEVAIAAARGGDAGRWTISPTVSPGCSSSGPPGCAASLAPARTG